MRKFQSTSYLHCFFVFWSKKLDIVEIIIDVGQIILDVGQIFLNIRNIIIDVAEIIIDVNWIISDVVGITVPFNQKFHFQAWIISMSQSAQTILEKFFNFHKSFQ